MLSSLWYKIPIPIKGFGFLKKSKESMALPKDKPHTYVSIVFRLAAFLIQQIDWPRLVSLLPQLPHILSWSLSCAQPIRAIELYLLWGTRTKKGKIMTRLRQYLFRSNLNVISNSKYVWPTLMSKSLHLKLQVAHTQGQMVPFGIKALSNRTSQGAPTCPNVTKFLPYYAF